AVLQVGGVVGRRQAGEDGDRLGIGRRRRGRGGGRGRGRRGRRVTLGGGGIALSASRQGQRPHQHRQPSRHDRLPVVLEPVAGALAQTASLVPQASRKERQRFWVRGSRK